MIDPVVNLIIALIPQDLSLSSSLPLPLLNLQEFIPKFIAIILLLALNAFFVAAEFSILSVRRSRMRQLALKGDVQAGTVESLQRSLDRLLSTTQLGITLSSLALGWIGEGSIAQLLSDFFSTLPLSDYWRLTLVHSVSIPLAFLGLVYVQIVFGELCPKAIALLYPEQMARVLATPSLAIAKIFHPFICILNQSTRFLLKLVGIEYDRPNWYSRLTSEELQLIISTTSESIGLEEEERILLNNVFEFGEVTAGDVMVPRTQIVAVSQDVSLQELLIEVSESRHSRYPLLGESLDDIRGIICFKELAKPWVEQNVPWDTPIKQWSRPVRFVPEYMPLSELLPLMQRSHQAMVIVVDEYGGTAGLITLEDVVEEIIGESPDLPTADTLRIEKLDEQTYLVPAQMDLEEVNHLLNLHFPDSEEYNSLGGFLIYRLQKIPETGESLLYESWLLTVEKSQGPRLDLIRITHCPGEDSSSGMVGMDIALPDNFELGLDLPSLSSDSEIN